MVSKVWIHGGGLACLLALSSCQFVTGLDDLELGSTGGQDSGGGPGSGGNGTGGNASECLTGWMSDPCRGVCGVEGDGIRVGCGNFMACYLEYDCLPETCSDDIDDLCGINAVESGTSSSLAMAEEVVSCLCAP